MPLGVPFSGPFRDGPGSAGQGATPTGTTIPTQAGSPSAGQAGQGALTDHLNTNTAANSGAYPWAWPAAGIGTSTGGYVQYAPAPPSPLDQLIRSAIEQTSADYQSQQLSSSASNLAAQQLLGLQGQSQGLDLNRQNQLYANQRRDAAANLGFADGRWNELQRNNAANRGFADQDLAIRQWLNSQNVGFTGRNLNIDLGQAQLAYDRSHRTNASDATSRGARTSQGYSDSVSELQRQLGLSQDSAQLGADRSYAGLNAESQTNTLNHAQAIEGLLNQYNNGQMTWQETKQAIDNALSNAGINNQYANQNYGLQQQVQGVQGAQQQAGFAQDQTQMSAQYREALLALQQMALAGVG